jgi:outer membrane immunogenic protein
MRHWLSVCITLAMMLASVDIAWAADVSVVYAPPRPVAAPFSTWTGCFIGANVGGVVSRSVLTETSPGTSSAFPNTEQSPAGGGQAGCDYQAGPWVVGVQGMFDGTGLRGGAAVQFPGVVGPATFFKESWFAIAAGRVGYAVDPAVLFYLKGGGSWTREERTGWVGGAGVEWKCLPNLSIFVEYNYAKFETNNVFATIPPLSANASVNLQTILVGANFRFDLGPPVTTRY